MCASSPFLLSEFLPLFQMTSFPSNTILNLAPGRAATATKNLSRRRFVSIYERPGSGARGETTLSWEFVDCGARQDPAFLVSFDELGFDDAFTEIYCKEAEKASSRALIGLERIVGARIYQRALEAKTD